MSSDLLPLRETGVAAFQERFPDAKGQGMTVAIIDTGIDPRAFGLGAERIKDIVDFTTKGDVDLVELRDEEIKMMAEHFEFTSFSGRTVRAKAHHNPSKKWYTAVKACRELYPEEIIWSRQFHNERRNDAMKAAEAELGDRYAMKDDERALIDKLERRWSDEMPWLEVLAWHDGSDWCCIVGGDETSLVVKAEDHDEGVRKVSRNRKLMPRRKRRLKPAVVDLTQKPILKNYHIRKDVHVINHDITLTVNFGPSEWRQPGESTGPKGKNKNKPQIPYLSLCVPSGTHGSHVAAITAGIAPECDIIGYNVFGISGGEDHALLKAFQAAINAKVHVVNLSLGSYSPYREDVSDEEPVTLGIRDMIDAGITVVVAAGNEGPALTTIGWPATIKGVISVGAYLTESLQKSAYRYLSNHQPGAGVFEWSSRGPTFDGARGVTVLAPGGAIVGVPAYGREKTALMNGTSMASPYMAGVITVLRAKLSQEGKSWSNARLLSGLSHTGTSVKDFPLTPLLDTEALFDFLSINSNDLDIDYVISIGRHGAEGICLRSIEDMNRKHTFSVDIQPNIADRSQRIAYSQTFTVTSQVPWVVCPAVLEMNSSGVVFQIEVDPRQLSDGVTTTTVVLENGAGLQLISIPISIIRPPSASPIHLSFKQVQFRPGHCERIYLSAPEGCTSVTIALISNSVEQRLPLTLDLSQVVHMRRPWRNWLDSPTLERGVRYIETFQVRPGACELVFAQNWATPSTPLIDIELDFFGVATDGIITIDSDQSEVEVRSTLRDINVRTFAGTSHAIEALEPCSSRLYRPLIRCHSKHTVYEMVNCYAFDYDGMDGGRVFVEYPSQIPYKAAVKLEIIGHDQWYIDCPGKYRIKMTLQSFDRRFLESLRNVKLFAETDYMQQVEVLGGRDIMLRKGDTRTLTVKAPRGKPGTIIYGHLWIDKHMYPITMRFVLPGARSKPKKKQTKRYDDVLEAQLAFGRSLMPGQRQRAYYDGMCHANPGNLECLAARLGIIDDPATKVKQVNLILSLLGESEENEDFDRARLRGRCWEVKVRHGERFDLHWLQDELNVLEAEAFQSTETDEKNREQGTAEDDAQATQQEHSTETSEQGPQRDSPTGTDKAIEPLEDSQQARKNYLRYGDQGSSFYAMVQFIEHLRQDESVQAYSHAEERLNSIGVVLMSEKKESMLWHEAKLAALARLDQIPLLWYDQEAHRVLDVKYRVRKATVPEDHMKPKL